MVMAFPLSARSTCHIHPVMAETAMRGANLLIRRILYLAQGYLAFSQTSLGFEPATFQLLDSRLYLLGYSLPM